MNKHIKHILIGAFLVRIIALIVIIFTGDTISTGLLGSTSINDDVRYMETGETYIQNARSIIDVEAHKTTMDSIEVGYYHDAFTSLWDWVICILYYLFREGVFVRIINIVFAIFCVKCIYDICKEIYGEKVARLASLLYAFLPYPILFSCFLYKDQFYTMILLLLFRKALLCAGHIKLSDFISMAILVVASMLTRSGLVVLVLGAILVLIYKKGHYKINYKLLLFVLPVTIYIISYIIVQSWDTIQIKLLSYVYEYAVDSQGGDLVDFFVIKSPSQLWRYPFALCFLLFQPLNLSLSVHNWMDVAGVLNIVFIPVAIGNILYLFSLKLKKDYLFWIFHLFFLVTIITSLGIVRHQYYLQPFIIIIYAVYFYQVKNKTFLIGGSALAVMAVIFKWILLI